MSQVSPSQAASDPHLSAWVEANAGAGKTHALANRVARLLLAGARPGRILCLTFTKAAAAEMQGRLFAQLGSWAMLPDLALRQAVEGIGAATSDLAQARRLFAQALETPGGLKILTIHAFCQIVLSRFPIEAGVSAGFEVMEDNSARAMIAEARTAMLERAGKGDAALAPALGRLVTETSEETLKRILNAALGNDRRKLEQFFAANADFAAAAWRAHGMVRGSDATGSFLAELRRDIALLKEARDWLNSGSKTDAKYGAILSDVLARDFTVDAFPVLGKYFLKSDGEPREKLAGKPLAEARPDLIAWLGQLQQRFCQAEESRRAVRAAELAEAALTLINAVRHAYRAAKKKRGLLDYDDLILGTLNLLKRSNAAAWVLYKLDGGMDHLLIDEAQDTSPEQWEIINLLTEEFFTTGKNRTVFAVGDEKQSIFSFQGADPSRFDINRNLFAERAAMFGQPFLNQPLTTSRRSAPDILAFVDKVFESETARTGLTSHNEPIRHDAHRQGEKGGVEFWTALPAPAREESDPWAPVDAPPPASPVVSLAERIAGLIADWLARRVALPGHEHPIRPGDIMILLPRREPFGSEVIRQLKARRVPVAGADRIALTEQIAVMDLVALGRFVLQREDDLNLAALLRSPLCGLSEEDIFALCHGREGSVWNSLARARGAVFEAAHVFLSQMLERAGYAPPFEFFSHALNGLEKRRALLARLGPESGDAVDEFLSQALQYERGQTPSLEGFLHWLEKGAAEIKRDMERARNEVRVMTVHGAKGLEADIVFLPDTTTLPEPPSRKGHLLYDDNKVLFPLSDAVAVKVAKQAEMTQTLHEHRRLLYVALTRARDRLYICGFENRRGAADDSWYRLAEEAARAIGEPVIRGEQEAFAFGHVDNEPRGGVEEPSVRPELPAWIKRPAPPERAQPRLIRPSDAAETVEGPVLSPLEGAVRFRRGQVAHTMLARLPELPRGKQRGAALAYCEQNGFGAELADEVVGVLENPIFAAAFGPDSQAEVAFQAALPAFGEKAQVTGRIDRLAVTKDEVLILDYKTNRPPPAREEDVDPVYLAQMALYRDGAARIFPGRRIVCGLVWTDGPSLLRLSGAVLDRQIAALSARLDPEGERS